jgi:hypothetical protein
MNHPTELALTLSTKPSIELIARKRSMPKALNPNIATNQGGFMSEEFHKRL